MDTPASTSYPPASAPAPAPVQSPPPTVPPVNHSSSKHVVWIVLAVVAVLAGAAYAWMQLNPAAPTESPSPSPTATADPTADWQTYTNAEYGFEVKYPADWKEIFVNDESQSLLSRVILEKSAGLGEEFPDTLDISVMSLTVDRFFSESLPPYRNIEPVQFAGISAQKFNNTPIEPMGRADHTSILIARNGILILLDYQTDADVNQILSTFKFTDPTAGWETYTNEIYGFEIQRPALGEPYDAVRTSISPLGEGVVFTVSTKDFPQGELKIESTLFCPEWSSYYLGTYSPCKKSEDEIFSTTVGTIRYSLRCYSEGGMGPGIPLSESSKAACGEIAKTFKTIPRAGTMDGEHGN